MITLDKQFSISAVLSWLNCYPSEWNISIREPYQFGEVHVSQDAHDDRGLRVCGVGSFCCAQCSQH